MIVRILGEGQWNVSDDQLPALNELDSAVEAAVDGQDRESFSRSFGALLHTVRDVGVPLPDESLEDSDLILPPSDATLEEVRELLSDEGLIPG